MKFLGFILINNRRGKYAIVDIKARITSIYLADGREAAYLAYRNIMDTGVQESWAYCKPLLREWEGKK